MSKWKEFKITYQGIAHLQAHDYADALQRFENGESYFQKNTAIKIEQQDREPDIPELRGWQEDD